MDNLRNKTTSSILWDLSSKVILQASGFVFSIVLARLLSPSDFGNIGLIVVVVSLANVFIDLGFGSALIQRKDVTNQDFSSVFFFNVTVSFLLSLLLFFSSDLIASFYKIPELSPLAKAISPVFVFSAFGTAISAKLKKELSFKILSKATIFGSISSGLIGISLAYLGFGVWSLLIQSLALPVLSNIYLFLSVKWRPVLKFEYSSLKKLWPFGSRLFYTGLLDMIFFNLDSILIGKYFNNTTLGYYYRAKSVENFAARYTSGSLTSVLFSSFSKIQDDKEKLERTSKTIIHLLSVVSFYVCGLLFVTSEDLFITLFTEKWRPAIHIFKLLIISAFSYQIQSIFGSILLSQGKSNYIFQLNVVSKILRGISVAALIISGIDLFLYLNIAANLLMFILYSALTIQKLTLKIGSFHIDMAKYFLAYSTSIFLCMLLYKHLLVGSSLVNFFTFSIIYSIAYILSQLVFNKNGFYISISEIKSLIKSIRRNEILV